MSPYKQEPAWVTADQDEREDYDREHGDGCGCFRCEPEDTFTMPIPFLGYDLPEVV